MNREYAVDSEKDLSDKWFYNMVKDKRQEVIGAIEKHKGALDVSYMVWNDGDEGLNIYIKYKWYDYTTLAAILDFAAKLAKDIRVLSVKFDDDKEINGKSCMINTIYHCCDPD